MRKKTTMLLALGLITSIFLNTTSFAENQNKEMDVIKAAEQSASKVLTQSYSKYYVINKVSISDEEVSSTDAVNYDVTFNLTMNTVLKAKKAEDLPFIKGMAKKLGLVNFSFESVDKTREKLKTNNKGKFDAAKVEKLSKKLNDKIAEVSQYINKSDDTTFFIKVKLKKNDGVVDPTSAKLFYAGATSFLPIEDILPGDESSYELQGENDIDDAIAATDSSVVSAQTYSNYDRLNARDYVNSWTKSGVTSCYDDGTSCGILQARNYWNNSSYPYYSQFKHNDCADFVSQGLRAGGIPTDSTWNRTGSGSVSWINVGSLKSYMYNTKGYFTASNYTNASAGAVICLKNSNGYYHTVMIVKNDTVTRQFTGHTNDRLQCAYSSNWGSGVTAEYYIINQ